MSWEYVCYPKKEGGLDLRFLHDVSRHSLPNYGAVLECLLPLFGLPTCGITTTKAPPLVTKNLGSSQVWRKMMSIRE